MVFYSGILSFSREKIIEIPFLSSGKDRFARRIQVLTPKTRFSNVEGYFTSEIVFYSGKLSFSREKLVENPFFSSGKDRFVRKILVLTPKTRFSAGI